MAVESIRGNTTGNLNVAAGHLALQNNVKGTNNTAVAAKALCSSGCGSRRPGFHH